MTKNSRNFWALGKTYGDWIDARINRALHIHAEQVELNAAAQRLELAHRLETRVTLATLESARSIAELREQVTAQILELTHRLETRVTLATLESARSLAEVRGQITYEAESRAQMAGREAKAYADAGLYTLSKSMAAATKVITNCSKRLGAHESTVAETSQRLESLAGAIGTLHEVQSQTAEALTQAISRIDNVQDQARLSQQVNAQASQRLESLAGAMRTLDEVQSQTAEALTEAISRIDGVVQDQAGLSEQVNAKSALLLQSNDSLRSGLDGAIADYNKQLRNAEQRIEFIRSETMYELQSALVKSALRKPEGGKNDTIRARIINASKVVQSKDNGLRLNIGCGHIQPEGFVNVDARELAGIDIVSEATNVPLAEGTVTEIFSSHLVEHFPENILHNVLLPHWHSLLKDDGKLTTIAPDGAAMLKAVNKGEMSFEEFREVLFGAQDYDGDFHYNLITPESFHRSLERAGFTEIDTEYLGRRNGKCLEFKITARKPSTN